MSMSLRDQLLAAGLVSQKQVRDAERQQQHQERGQQQRGQQQRGQRPKPHPASTPQAKADGNDRSEPGRKPAATAGGAPLAVTAVGASAPSAATRSAAAQSAKVARDLALNRKQQEKAQQRARAAQIKQLIEQNRVPRGEHDERFNFVQGGRVRFIGVNAEIRRRLLSGELVIVRHEGVHDVVPAAVGQRIRERDAHAVIDAAAAPPASSSVDDAYKDFAVPDDLMW